jgi:membrane fusion protein (multidrug efflux system)
MMRTTGLACAGLALILSACGGGSSTPATGDTQAAPAPLELAQADIAVVSKAALGNGLPVTGTLQAFHQTTVQARMASDVAEVYVREGQLVKKGEALARLGTQDAESRLKEAEANLASAKVAAQLSRALAERNRALFEKHYFSELDYQNSVGDADTRDQAVKAQEALVAIARKSLNDATVMAPMSGIVAKRYIDAGSSVGMDNKLFDIVDLAEMELAAPVPAPRIPEVKVGQAVSFMVDGFGSRQFSGRVARINPVADSGTRAISVYISVDNNHLDLKGGMFAHGQILTGSDAPTLIVPVDAVHTDPGSNPYVLVLKNGKLERRDVTPGASDAQTGRVAVSTGLAVGETVVVAKLAADASNRPARVSGS